MAERPVVLIFGGSGNTGRWLVKCALEDARRKVVCFVRDEAKLKSVVTESPVNFAALEDKLSNDPENKESDLTIVTGDLLDRDAIERALGLLGPGDTIICTAGKPVGCKDKSPLMPEFLKILVPLMRARGVKRLLYQGGAMSAPAGRWKTPGQHFAQLFIAPVLGVTGMVSDNVKVAAFLAKECKDIEWIYPRPGALKDGGVRKRRRDLKVSFFANVLAIAFEDLANWIWKAAFDDALVHKSPYVA